jgi:hypothetical protein
MKRLALLIGSPSHPDTSEAGVYLPGVKTDIENMYRFLRSSIGGSWEEEEIQYFYPNPSSKEVSPYLDACKNVDIAFVYFSGHGGTDTRNNASRVQFQYNDNPYVMDLAKKAKHQITIIDACRTATQYYNSTGNISEGISGMEFPNPYPEKSRKIYDEYVNNIPYSKILLHATSPGLTSTDLGRKNGGLFSTSLLEIVKREASITNKPVLDIAKIFTKAKIETNRKELKQIPVLYATQPHENAYKLPLGINPNFNFSGLKTYENFIKKEDNLIQDIVKAGLVGVGIIGAGILIGSLLSKK